MDLINSLNSNRAVLATDVNSTDILHYIAELIVFQNNVEVAIIAPTFRRATMMLAELKTVLGKGMKYATNNQSTIELKNGSHVKAMAASSATALRGNSPNIVYVESAVDLSSKVLDEVMNCVMPVVLRSETAKLIINWGQDEFRRLWKQRGWATFHQS
jgi:hypothetical protein